MSKPILVSGIQTSGRLHIGNYLGALKNFVDLQKSGKYQCYFFLADLHSLTEYPASAKEQQKRVLELAADYLAAGLDPKKSVIYQQSQIPAHSELAWILNTITPLGELERMTQYKDKAARQSEGVNTGILTYPVLMAADIILYDAKFVPVGNDQDQHLELTRTLARKFNGKFPGRAGGKTFVEPQPLHTPTPRVMSLKDPTKKMSKSQPETCLFLDDSPADIEAKIKGATTDSGSEVRFDPQNKPGISNLLGIYAGLSGRSVEKLEKEFAGQNYGAFKRALIGVVTESLAPYRAKKAALLKKPTLLRTTLRQGSGRAAKVASRKIALVKKAVGLML
ncbi:MAG TPA: tryptophan--tRNA ligase [Candidatus Paceibacterota bacterium]|nr:tryptophan--tRNA ligase [Candidatus Paceibacterota bacterium]